jgi:N,N'-diacetyllegionaminate synthase
MKIGELFDNVNDGEHKTYVIAEIGINHEGSVDRCAEMIRASASAGADAIKLQTVDASRCYARDTKSYKVFSEAALTEAETMNMFQLARDCGVDAFTTSGDLQTLKWVDRLSPAAHKISSGLLSCIPIVKEACKLGRPVLMSTGMSGIATIDQSVEIARQSGCQTALFQCTSLYPCPIKKLDLSTIAGLSKRYRVPTGFSDHSLGVNMAPLAVAAGARLIEKHITFDKNRSGFDHSISLETDEFAEMVTLVRQAETALGQADKTVDDVIFEQAQQFERRLAAAHDLPEGHVLTIDDLLFMRFSKNVDAISSCDTDAVLDRQTNSSISAGQSIKWQYLS